MPEVTIRYIGADALIAHPDGSGEEIARGETCEVSADRAGKAPTTKSLGEGLLAQTDKWEPVSGSRTKSAAAASDTEEA